MMTQPGSDVVYFRLGGSKPRCCPLLTLPRGLALFAASLLLVTTIYYFPSMADTHENFTMEDTAAVSMGLGKFTASLYQVVAKTVGSSENVFISPFSVAAVSTLALAGARGNTAQQMKNTLHVNNIEDSKLSGIVGKIVKSIKGDENYTLEAANRMYVQENYQLLEQFQTNLKEHFGVTAQSVNFGAEETRNVINKWVEEVTRDKIKDLLPAGSLTSLTRLALVNAVYFKGKWLNQFAVTKTQVQPFYLGSDEKTVDVQMMHHHAEYRHGDLQAFDARILELPYEGRKMSMFIILPNKVDGLAELESKLASENVLDSINTAMRMPTKIEVAIPKFKLEASVELNEHLKALGMSDLFDENSADLSGISGKKDLYVSKVFHKTFVEVNEEGSEAAAATGMIMMTRMMPMMVEPPPPFIADRPFMFAIRDNFQKLVLFVGRVSNPAAK